MLELLVVMAGLGVLMAIALPAFTNMVRRSRVTSTFHQVSSLMGYARLQAVQRHNNVVFALTTDSSSPNFRRAIVFDDPNGNGVQDAGEAMLRNYALPPDNLGIHLMFKDGVNNSVTAVQFDGYAAALPSIPGSGNLKDEVIFTSFGSILTPDSYNPGTNPPLGVYFGDDHANYFRVGIDNPSTAKTALGKWNGTAYLPAPWQWN
jgi:Tfp pilus assembly protein PilE